MWGEEGREGGRDRRHAWGDKRERMREAETDAQREKTEGGREGREEEGRGEAATGGMKELIEF